jgi:hypothetical protein
MKMAFMGGSVSKLLTLEQASANRISRRVEIRTAIFYYDAGRGAEPALQRSLVLAQHAERLGFSRFWVAEHYNMESIASSAPRVPIFRGQGSFSSRPKLLLSVKAE